MEINLENTQRVVRRMLMEDPELARLYSAFLPKFTELVNHLDRKEYEEEFYDYMICCAFANYMQFGSKL
jgi:hypothetical protein